MESINQRLVYIDEYKLQLQSIAYTHVPHVASEHLTYIKTCEMFEDYLVVDSITEQEALNIHNKLTSSVPCHISFDAMFEDEFVLVLNF